MHLPTYLHMTPYMSVTSAIIFFSLRLGLTDFLVLHKDCNIILWSILGTLNMMSHTYRIVQYLFENSNATIHLIANRSPYVCDYCCHIFFR